jgi:hypothetical protein
VTDKELAEKKIQSRRFRNVCLGFFLMQDNVAVLRLELAAAQLKISRMSEDIKKLRAAKTRSKTKR